jgi:predicted RND superfamily exporter protein
MINIVFIVDIETTIRRAIQYQNANDESQWTFGQTLALLLLVLPMRDVFDYIKESREAEYARECTEALKDAVKHRDIESLREAAKCADNVHAYIDGKHAFSYLG